MKIISNLKQILSKRKYVLIFLVSSFFVLASYYYTLVNVVPLEIFLGHNSELFIFLQIVLSVLNSLLSGVAITFFFAIKPNVKTGKASSLVGVLVSFVTTIFTTGCYVCGSLLLPSLGIATGLALLPLGGIEVKLATIIILLYSIHDLHEKYQGVCRIYPDKKFKLIMDNDNELIIDLKPFYKWRGLVAVYTIALMIVILPGLFIGEVSVVNNPQNYSCSIDRNGK